MLSKDDLSFIKNAIKKKVIDLSDQEEQPVIESLGKYRIIKLIGRGGLGDVYLAQDMTLHRNVALKILTRASPHDIERFYREARIAAQLNHPNIVQVHEIGNINNLNYISMQYIDGKNLEETDLDIKKALEVINEISRAIFYAHSMNIIHRDIKPSNIIVDNEGKAFLMDFGIAKEIKDRSIKTLSVTGMIIGTPAYMSPEQAQGEISRIDTRTDIYSLGATLYFLIMREHPFKGRNTLQIINSVIAGDIVSPRQIRKDIPRDLEAIILKAMNKKKDARYQSALELANDIDRFLKGEPTIARPTSITMKIIKRAKKYKFAVLAAVILTTIIAGLFFYMKKAGEEAKKREQLELYNKSMQCLNNAITMLNKLRPRFYEKDLDLKATRKEVDKIINELTESIKTYPLEQAFYQRAKLYTEIGKFEEAQDDLGKAIKRNPAPYLYLELVNLYLSFSFMNPLYRKKASFYLQKARSQNPSEVDEATLLFMQAVDCLERGEYDESIAKLKRGYDQSADVEFLFSAAYAYGLKGSAEEMLDLLSKCISIKPFFIKAYLLRYSYYYLRRDEKSAENELNKALEINPDTIIPYIIKSKGYRLTGDLESALDQLDQAIKLRPDFAWLYVFRSIIYNNKQDHEKAIADLNKAIGLEPDNPYCYSYRGAAYLVKGIYITRHNQDPLIDLAKAFDDYTYALKIDPRHFDSYQEKIDTIDLINDAIECLTEFLVSNPDSAKAFTIRGIAYYYTGEYKKAVSDLEKAIQLDPKDKVAVAYLEKAKRRLEQK